MQRHNVGTPNRSLSSTFIAPRRSTALVSESTPSAKRLQEASHAEALERELADLRSGEADAPRYVEDSGQWVDPRDLPASGPIALSDHSPLLPPGVFGRSTTLAGGAGSLSADEAAELVMRVLDGLGKRNPGMVSDGARDAEALAIACKLKGNSIPVFYGGAELLRIVADRVDADRAQPLMRTPVITLREAQVLASFDHPGLGAALIEKVRRSLVLNDEGRFVPSADLRQPDVRCTDCEHFTPDSINPEGGLGRCADKTVAKGENAYNPAPSPWRNKPCAAFSNKPR